MYATILSSIYFLTLNTHRASRCRRPYIIRIYLITNYCIRVNYVHTLYTVKPLYNERSQYVCSNAEVSFNITRLLRSNLLGIRDFIRLHCHNILSVCLVILLINKKYFFNDYSFNSFRCRDVFAIKRHL